MTSRSRLVRGEGYRPASDWLLEAANREIAFEAPEAEMDLARLIVLTRDADASNRDWALLLLQQSDADTPKVRAALVAALNDSLKEASLEALIGLAKRDPRRVLPIVNELLQGEWVGSMALEAASWVADPALLPELEAIKAEDTAEDDPRFVMELDEALDCCRRGEPPFDRPGQSAG